MPLVEPIRPPLFNRQWTVRDRPGSYRDLAHPSCDCDLGSGIERGRVATDHPGNERIGAVVDVVHPFAITATTHLSRVLQGVSAALQFLTAKTPRNGVAQRELEHERQAEATGILAEHINKLRGNDVLVAISRLTAVDATGEWFHPGEVISTSCRMSNRRPDRRPRKAMRSRYQRAATSSVISARWLSRPQIGSAARRSRDSNCARPSSRWLYRHAYSFRYPSKCLADTEWYTPPSPRFTSDQKPSMVLV